MFGKWKKRKKEREQIEATMRKLLSCMSDPNISSEETRKLRQSYEYHYKILHPMGRLDINTLITVGGSVLTVLLILHYEKLDSVLSRAVNFVLKPKLK